MSDTVDSFQVSVKRFVSDKVNEAGEHEVLRWEAWLSGSQVPKGRLSDEECSFLQNPPTWDGKWLTFSGETETAVRLAVKEYVENYSCKHSDLDMDYINSKMRRTWRMRTVKLSEPRERSEDGSFAPLFPDDDDDW